MSVLELLQKVIESLNNEYPTVGFAIKEQPSDAFGNKGIIKCLKTGIMISYKFNNDQINISGKTIFLNFLMPISPQINTVKYAIIHTFEYIYTNRLESQALTIENNSSLYIVNSAKVNQNHIDCIINDIHIKFEYFRDTVTASTKDGLTVSNKVPDAIFFGNILETTIETLLSMVSLQQPDKIKLPDAYLSNKIKTKLDILTTKGVQQILPYLSERTLHSIFYMYLFSKYKSKCFPIKYRLLIRLNENKEPPSKEQINITLNSVGATVQCIMNNSKIFIIPVSLTETNAEGKFINGHANCLIYRRQYNHLEHFEPHGQEFNGGSQSQNINLLLTEFMKAVNENLAKQGHQPVTLIHSTDVCPSKKGFQAIEEASTLLRSKHDNNGYCAAWSMFFAEMCLKNPTKTSNELIRYILTSIPKDKNKNNYLRELIRGYVHLINDKLAKYLTKIFPGTNMNKLFSNDTPTIEKVNFLIDYLINTDITSYTHAQFQKNFDSVSPNSLSLDSMSPIKMRPQPPKGLPPQPRFSPKPAPSDSEFEIEDTPPFQPPKGPLPVKATEPECGPGKRCKRGTCKKGVCQVKV